MTRPGAVEPPVIFDGLAAASLESSASPRCRKVGNDVSVLATDLRINATRRYPGPGCAGSRRA